MASTLQKLIRRSQPTRIVAALHSSPSSNPSVPLIFGEPRHIEVKQEPQLTTNLSSFLVEHIKDDSRPFPFRKIYPSFSLGFFLNPISVYGSVSSEAEDAVQDDSGNVWADSVKKKRKRKMNKHKYKKLRKHLRRQT